LFAHGDSTAEILGGYFQRIYHFGQEKAAKVLAILAMIYLIMPKPLWISVLLVFAYLPAYDRGKFVMFT